MLKEEVSSQNQKVRQADSPLNYIKSDCYRYYGKTDLLSLVKAYIRNRSFRFQVAFRLYHGTGIVKLIGHALWGLNRTRKNRIQISKHMKAGYGLYIGHDGPIIINPTAVIGNNCNLSQFTTIGSNEGAAAIIGDNVYIGPNVCVVGNVTIGDNATIGAGSVVTKDIPQDATAAGNYAKVLNYNNPARYILNKWEIKN